MNPSHIPHVRAELERKQRRSRSSTGGATPAVPVGSYGQRAIPPSPGSKRSSTRKRRNPSDYDPNPHRASGPENDNSSQGSRKSRKISQTGEGSDAGSGSYQEIGPDGAPVQLRRRLRKNTREKERRLELNDKFEKLCEILQLGRTTKAEKFTILSEAISTIGNLKKQNANLLAEKVELKSEMGKLTNCLKKAFPAQPNVSAGSTSNNFASAGSTATQARAPMPTGGVAAAAAQPPAAAAVAMVAETRIETSQFFTGGGVPVPGGAAARQHAAREEDMVSAGSSEAYSHVPSSPTQTDAARYQQQHKRSGVSVRPVIVTKRVGNAAPASVAAHDAGQWFFNPRNPMPHVGTTSASAGGSDLPDDGGDYRAFPPGLTPRVQSRDSQYDDGHAGGLFEPPSAALSRTHLSGSGYDDLFEDAENEIKDLMLA